MKPGGLTKFKRTPALNPGSEYGEGGLRWTYCFNPRGRGDRAPIHIRVGPARGSAAIRKGEGWRTQLPHRYSRDGHPAWSGSCRPILVFTPRVPDAWGSILPGLYLQAPTAFQGSNLVLGILFGFLFELPDRARICVARNGIAEIGRRLRFHRECSVRRRRWIHGRLRVLRPVDPSAGGPVRRPLPLSSRRRSSASASPPASMPSPHDRDEGRHGERHHHLPPRERGHCSGPAGYGLRRDRHPGSSTLHVRRDPILFGLVLRTLPELNPTASPY